MVPARYAFGPFVLDTDQGVLFEHGQPVSMGGKALKLLQVLLEARGQVVTKSALLDAAWPDTTVEESNLTVQIAALRTRFRDTCDGEDWIATFPRVGYRFAGKFTVNEHKASASGTMIESVRGERRTRNWPALVGAGLLLALVLSAAGWLLQPWRQGMEAASVERMALPLPDKPAIVVLPFINISNDSEQDFFADGITDDLITELSKVSGLFVIARNTSFSYKGNPIKTAQVAEELGVHYVLEGSVQRAGDRVRINAQLTDALVGGQVWADRFDGSIADVFALQDKVTNTTADALAVRLTPSQEAAIDRKETAVPAAYDQFLRGWQHYRQTTPVDYAKAVAFFEEAIKLDPNYYRAYAALALVYVMSSNRDWTSGIGVSGVEARVRAQRYLKIAQQQPSALTHQVSGAVYLGRGLIFDSIAEFKKAIDLDPSDSWSYAFASLSLSLASRPDEAMKYINAAIRLDPHPPALFLSYLGYAQFNAEKFDAAAVSLERATTLNPDDQYALLALGAAYGYLGRKRDAESTIGRHDGLAVQLGGVPATVENCGAVWQTATARLSKGLRLAGVPESLSSGEFFEKNRLTAQEIRSLLFGRRVHGRSSYYGKEWAALFTDNGVATISGDWILPNLASVPGSAQFKKDDLCISINMTIYCDAVIRNPGGTMARENEFIWRGYTFARAE